MPGLFAATQAFSPLTRANPLPTYYREFRALKNVSFEIKKGETVGIIGRNGSGKSTLPQLICGTLPPTGGNMETKRVQAEVTAEVPMKKSFTPSVSTNSEVASLFERVAGILESGRGRVLRTVNHETVWAYWLIGREIVQALQGGEARAQYGNTLIADLSKRLTESYGAGFSVANLKNFRQFYLAYADRAVLICHPSSSHLAASDGINPKGYPAGSESPSGFYPNLSWSHYRALMRVENNAARQFYEVATKLCRAIPAMRKLFPTPQGFSNFGKGLLR